LIADCRLKEHSIFAAVEINNQKSKIDNEKSRAKQRGTSIR